LLLQTRIIKTMMVFDAEGKKQYVENTKKVASSISGSLPEKQEAKQGRNLMWRQKKTKKKKVSIKM
jgi:hypothetical protein